MNRRDFLKTISALVASVAVGKQADEPRWLGSCYRKRGKRLKGKFAHEWQLASDSSRPASFDLSVLDRAKCYEDFSVRMLKCSTDDLLYSTQGGMTWESL